MSANDRNLYKATEQFKLRIKDAELKARNHCVKLQQEKGPDVKLIEFFDECLKKYEFQLGLTPGIIDESLVRENQRLQEERERDQLIDTDDLGLGAPVRKSNQNRQADISVFQPPKENKAQKWDTFDQNQTIKLGGGGEDTIMNGSRIPHMFPRGQGGGVNDTANETLVNVVATLNKEDNDRSETGGDDYQNPEWLKDKRAENMDIGGNGGTGSSA